MQGNTKLASVNSLCVCEREKTEYHLMPVINSWTPVDEKVTIYSRAMCLMALWHSHFFANPCLPFNITPSVKTFSQRANAGTSITLLSICDLPALHPPSESSPTMEKGEGGSALRYSVIHCRCTGSRTGDSIQFRQRKGEKIHSVCSAQEIWDGKKENFDKWQMQTSWEPTDSVCGRRKIDLLFPLPVLKNVETLSHLSRPRTSNTGSRVQDPTKKPPFPLLLQASRRALHRTTSGSDAAQKSRETGICHWAELLSSLLYWAEHAPWSSVPSCCTVGNLPEFCSSHPVWHNSCWFLHFRRFRQNLASETGQCEMEV